MNLFLEVFGGTISQPKQTDAQHDHPVESTIVKQQSFFVIGTPFVYSVFRAGLPKF